MYLRGVMLMTEVQFIVEKVAVQVVVFQMSEERRPATAAPASAAVSTTSDGPFPPTACVTAGRRSTP